MNNAENLTKSQDESIPLLLVILLALIIIFAFKLYRDTVIPFITERNYIKREISRASSNREYRHWKRRLKRLYISTIPILGRFMLKNK